MRQDEFLAAIDEPRIVAAIRAAEARSRGEIRVHVAEGGVSDPRRAAEADFERLGMAATAERNGVLILVAPESQSFAVIGDRGIDERLPPGFWDELAASLRDARRRRAAAALPAPCGGRGRKRAARQREPRLGRRSAVECSTTPCRNADAATC